MRIHHQLTAWFAVALAIAALKAEASRESAPFFMCYKGKEEIDVQIGQDEAHQSVVLSADINPNNYDDDEVDWTPVRCRFKLFSEVAGVTVLFRLANLTLESGDCDEASLKLFDVQSDSFVEGRSLKRFCSSPTSKGWVRSVGSPSYGMIVELEVKTSQRVKFTADVYAMPSPCHFTCPGTDICYHSDQWCDGVNDCEDSSDERDCPAKDDAETTSEDETDKVISRLGAAISSSGCGNSKIQKGLKGSFTSLHYPCHYENRLNCGWEITVPTGMAIAFAFNSIFEIENGTAGGSDRSLAMACGYDSLNIYSRQSATPSATGSGVQLINSFCGSEKPSAFYVRNNMARVEFKSDHERTGYGFRLQWAAVKPEEMEKNVQGSPRSVGLPGSLHRPGPIFKTKGACSPDTRGNELTAKQGSFGSPRLVNGAQYSYETTCTWLIKGGADEVVVLFFAEFSLEPSPKCEFDYVEIVDGNNVFGRYCGDAFVPPITSSTNKLIVKFSSDKFVEDRGFKAYYRIVKESDVMGSRQGYLKTAPVKTGADIGTSNVAGTGAGVGTVVGTETGSKPVVSGVVLDPSRPAIAAPQTGTPVVVSVANLPGAPTDGPARPGRVPPGSNLKKVPSSSTGDRSGIAGDLEEDDNIVDRTASILPAEPPKRRRGVSELDGDSAIDVARRPESVTTTEAADEHHLEWRKSSLCGNVPGNAFGATFSGTCHGALIHKRWMLATTSCLEIADKDAPDSRLNFAPIYDWTTNNTIGKALQISIKTFKFRGEESLTAPFRFTGLSLVQLAQPVDAEAKTPAVLCLPTDNEDSDAPDASCEFPRTPLAVKKSFDLHRLSNDKCAYILLAADNMKVPPNRLHFFECFLAQDVDVDEETLVSDFANLPVKSRYCEVGNSARYKALFNEFPLKFCKNYEEKWSVSGVLVQVLTSNLADCSKSETTLSTPAERPQRIAVYVRVSHFYEWIFTITGNGGASDDSKFVKTEDL